MNHASAFLITFVAEKDTYSIDLSEQEAFLSGPALVDVFVQKLVPGQPESICDSLGLYQVHANLVSGTTNSATETGNGKLPLFIRRLGTRWKINNGWPVH